MQANDPKLVTISRRAFLRRSMKWVGGLVGLGVVACTYGYAWERTALQIERVSLSLPRLPNSFADCKLVHFSDVHLGHFFKPEQLQGVLDLIQNEQPDLICFTGDIVDLETQSFSAAIPMLAKLEAPLGKFAVLGNHDYRQASSMRFAKAGLLLALRCWTTAMWRSAKMATVCTSPESTMR